MNPVFHARGPDGNAICSTRTIDPQFAKPPMAVSCKTCLTRIARRRKRVDSWAHRQGVNRGYLVGTDIDKGLEEL